MHLLQVHGHVLRRKDGHVLRRAFDFELMHQRKKGRPKRTWKKVQRLAWEGKMYIPEQGGVLVLIRLLLG